MTTAYYGGIIAKAAKTPPLEQILPKRRRDIKVAAPARPKTAAELEFIMLQWRAASAHLTVQ